MAGAGSWLRTRLQDMRISMHVRICGSLKRLLMRACNEPAPDPG